MSGKNNKTCSKCQKDRKLTDFYTSYSPMDADGKIRICKTCVQSMINIDNVDSWKDTLRQLDKPFMYHLHESAMSKNSPIGEYFKLINAKDYRSYTWKDSVEDAPTKDIPKENRIENTSPSQFVLTDELINKWGEGYTDEEYRSFERKYHMLKNNYQEKTAMHTEALLTYIRYRVKEELATAKGNVKEAKDWGALAEKSATAAKINPSQLSKSDLSDGLDTFGQLVRTVEQAIDIIPILPVFKERPQDKVDFTLHCYINYIRDLKGLPLVEYEEVYKFYEQRKKDYEQDDESDLDG
jgi:hypothetical protein